MAPTMAQILWNTFGFVGLASVAAWVAASLALVAGVPRRRRLAAWAAAAGLAVAGWLLAATASWSIRSIEVDRSAEMRAAEAGAARVARERLTGRAADIRFAEDTDADRADLAGVTVAEERGSYERAMEEQIAKLPAYRRRGRQQRTRPGAKATGDAQTSGTAAAPEEAAGEVSGDVAAERPDPGQRRLPEAHLMVADRFDRRNRAAATAVLLSALGLVAWEYVRRFNTTFAAACPVPLAGTPVDGLFPKDHVVAARGAEAPALADFLAATVRKGETFVAFVAADPLRGRDALDRIGAGPLRLTLPCRCFASGAVAADASLAETVLETAWFGRGAFVLEGEGGAEAVLSGMAAALERRRAHRARIRRTLNLVWALPSPPPADVWDELAFLAPAVNLRIVNYRA